MATSPHGRELHWTMIAGQVSYCQLVQHRADFVFPPSALAIDSVFKLFYYTSFMLPAKYLSITPRYLYVDGNGNKVCTLMISQLSRTKEHEQAKIGF
jgi:hypothetical protein